ncbi:flagellar basal body rod protein FlgC [Roseobacter denitrificans]|uniref:Flagellar basal body rod protein FlgB n=2 Tax=Roseobacter TaxID=2433 RepID=Q16DG3_ROSDO|nr:MULTISPECIES: flagellar basal body rod protein FlgC [Roseobacter]ABG29980.1 flagellar basal-body rod protein FlgC [Roseobacter denitrificans OCh 114]AEI96235.1 flagellar basal-body rod protein FlgC [Roseobacter litoralis Och 149]AVL53188.1 flagellar basal body rod protein FlgC [Roseobacter denitrificans]SFG39316.1 flagellar basal-body rod protein FlgC [Roseobacter denitrificans OCh 114]GIT86481.1 flagellar basal body rod protein FlgC [Roseobacter sp. OBYS 0001]
MSEFSKSLDVTTSGLKAQATRLRHLSENISNADTPGYRRKLVSFETAFGGQGVSTVETSRVRLDQSTLERVYDPSHPMADESGYFDGSNVDLLIELSDAREAQRSYEANLKVFEQTRKMSSSLMELLRK